jgi:hypothetical protein
MVNVQQDLPLLFLPNAETPKLLLLLSVGHYLHPSTTNAKERDSLLLNPLAMSNAALVVPTVGCAELLTR